MCIDVLLARLEILHRALVLQYIPLSLNILVLLSIDLDIVSEVHKNHMHCNAYHAITYNTDLEEEREHFCSIFSE